MSLFKWNVIKAGPYYFVRKRAWYLLYLGYNYSSTNPNYFWGSIGNIVIYCKFSTYELAVERCEILNKIGV